MLKLVTAAQVELQTKVSPEDLRLTAEQYTTFVVERIDFASATVLSFTNRAAMTQSELDADLVLKSQLAAATLLLIHNYLLVNMQMKTGQLVNVGEFTVAFADRKVFTEDIIKLLLPLRVQQMTNIPKAVPTGTDVLGWNVLQT